MTDIQLDAINILVGILNENAGLAITLARANDYQFSNQEQSLLDYSLRLNDPFFRENEFNNKPKSYFIELENRSNNLKERVASYRHLNLTD